MISYTYPGIIYLDVLGILSSSVHIAPVENLLFLELRYSSYSQSVSAQKLTIRVHPSLHVYLMYCMMYDGTLCLESLKYLKSMGVGTLHNT